ncbi:MAG: TIM barrel protein [Thermoplasmata archaeon]|nr:TIM barrel protein [Thermoplasmata archaeon]
MIRFGPAGIPLSCKGRTLRDGIEDVHNLGLTAMEVQLVRVGLVERHATEEEVGIAARDIPNALIVEIVREEGSRKKVIAKLDAEVMKGDLLHILASGIAKDYHELVELGRLSRDLDIELSLHTPYYMDLIGIEDMGERSMDSVKWGGLLANEMGAKVVVTHLGLYGDLTNRQAGIRVRKNLDSILKWFRSRRIKAKLGLESSGRQEVFGSLKEIISLCEKYKGVIPVLNFSHIHSREGGSLRTSEDFQKLFDKFKKHVRGHFHTHFSGVEHADGNELRYTPIKKGDLRFEPLAECILDNNYDITLISGSPLLEHDAMYMKVILERVLARRVAKTAKEGKK